MPLLQPDHALEVCRHLVQASSADETEVSLECVEENYVRFDERGPTQSADRERYHLVVRARVQGPGGTQEGQAACGSLDCDDGRAALERALTLARLAGPRAGLLPMPGPAAVRETAAQRPTRDHTLREKVGWITAAQSACRRDGLLPAGLARTGAIGRTLVNSAGREVTGAVSDASFALTAFRAGEAGGSAMAEVSNPNVERLEIDEVIESAVERAVRSRGPVDHRPRETTVVLMPHAVSALLHFAGHHGFGAQEFAERSSFLCERVGKSLFPDSVRIYDDAGHEIAPGMPFDGQGWPRERFALLEGGSLQGPVTDANWAARLGVPNSGHGFAAGQGGRAHGGPSPENLVVAAGNETLEQLIAGVEDGLLVNQLHYTNMIEPRDLTLTGMTRGGTFRIQGGRVTQAVRNLRFTETLVNVLQRVSGVGSVQQAASNLAGGRVVCPAMRVERFRFTSTTDF